MDEQNIDDGVGPGLGEDKFESLEIVRRTSSGKGGTSKNKLSQSAMPELSQILKSTFENFSSYYSTNQRTTSIFMKKTSSNSSSVKQKSASSNSNS